MDLQDFKHLTELENSGRIEEAIRESQIRLAKATDPNEKASLLGGIHVSYCKLGRLAEARQTLDQLKQIEISDLEVRLNAEFCEPCLLIQEGKREEGVTAFATMLQRHSEAFKEDRFRYLYEDIQCRRALVLVGLSRFKEALPILKEAVYFSFDEPADRQRVHFALGVCLEETNDTDAARNEFVRVAGFGLKNDLEERARYHIARFCFTARAFAQARQQLEIILRDYPDGGVVSRKYVYEQLSHTCRHLGDKSNAKRYMDLARHA